MSNTNNNLQLELHVPDFKKVLEFYGEVLGFKTVWMRNEGDAEDYLVMGRDGVVLNFWSGNDTVYEQSYFSRFPKNTKRGYGVEIVVSVEDTKKYHEEIKDKVNIVNPLVKRPWGLWDFRIEDPFGFYIRFTDKHDITDNAYEVKK